jgi:hypothetical protein
MAASGEIGRSPGTGEHRHAAVAAMGSSYLDWQGCEKERAPKGPFLCCSRCFGDQKVWV